MARYFPDARMQRVVFGFAGWRSPTGKCGNVAVIGVDGAELTDDAFMAERSDLARLNLKGTTGERATIGTGTLQLAATTDRLPTFLGAPYVGDDGARQATAAMDGVHVVRHHCTSNSDIRRAGSRHRRGPVCCSLLRPRGGVPVMTRTEALIPLFFLAGCDMAQGMPTNPFVSPYVATAVSRVDSAETPDARFCAGMTG